MRHIEERGSVYLPQVNAIYVHEFKMMYAAEEAARFLNHACRGLPFAEKFRKPLAVETSSTLRPSSMRWAISARGCYTRLGPAPKISATVSCRKMQPHPNPG